MKKIIFLSFIAIVNINLQAQNNPVITTVILVRHAEKAEGEDPDLRPEGHDRAKRLATMLKNTTINGVYSTSYKRTRSTVNPVAQNKGIEVQIYENMKANELDALMAKHAGQTIVIGGHSNTVPQIANLLLGKDEFKNFADTEYGNLLIVSVVERGKTATVTRLTY